MSWQYNRRSRKQFRREGQNLNFIPPTPGFNNYNLKRFVPTAIPDLSLLGANHYRHQLKNTGATPPPPVAGKNFYSLRRIVRPVTQDLSVFAASHTRRLYLAEPPIPMLARSYGVIII